MIRKMLLLLMGCLCFSMLPAQKLSIPLPADFYQVGTSENSPYVLLTMRPIKKGYYTNKGTYCVVDATTGQTLWTRELDYRLASVSLLTDKVLYTSGIKAVLYDCRTGEKVGQEKILTTYIDVERDVWIGYRSEFNHKVKCLQLSTGKLLWEQEIPCRTGRAWWSLQRVGENHLLFVADNLCLLNLQTGELKVHEAKTNIPNVKANFAVGALSALSFALGGGTMATSNGRTGGLFSNVLNEEGRYYFSDRIHLACMDSTLNEIWRYDFPEKETAGARLVCKGDTLFMLNEGTGVFGNRVLKVGKPFFAAFRKSTGEKLNLDYLPEEWDKEHWGKFLNFVSGHLFLRDASGEAFSPLYRPGNVYPLFTAWDDVALVNSRLDVLAAYPPEQVYVETARFGEDMLVSSLADSSECFLLDKDGKVKSRIGLSRSEMLVKGDKIYTLGNGRDYLIISSPDKMNAPF